MPQRHGLRATSSAGRELDDRLAAVDRAGRCALDHVHRGRLDDRGHPGGCDEPLALGRGHAGIQRYERAAHAPHREPRRDRAGLIRRQHTDRLAPPRPARAAAQGDRADRAQLGARRGRTVQADATTSSASPSSSAPSDSLTARSRRAGAGRSPRVGGRSASGSTARRRATCAGDRRRARISRCRHRASAPRSHARSNAAHVARSGIAQITIASVSVAITTLEHARRIAGPAPRPRAGPSPPARRGTHARRRSVLARSRARRSRPSRRPR